MNSQLILSLKKQKNLYGSKIKLLSPAKINLYLNILGKYSKEFHKIESVVERISLCDEITIELKRNPAINISSNNQDLQTSQNLCLKAAKALQEELKLPFGFDIFLRKNIPVGSGLGGGSSNAASTLLGLTMLLGLDLGKQQLYALGAKLGSDINFFLSENKFAFLEGSGQKVTPWNIFNSYKHFIIWPAIIISTKKVYKACRVKLTKFFNNVKILQYALKNNDLFLIRESVFNALEVGAFVVCDELKEVKDYLKKKNIFCKLTGSGSAFYTITKSTSISKIKSMLPKKWYVFEAATF